MPRPTGRLHSINAHRPNPLRQCRTWPPPPC